MTVRIGIIADDFTSAMDGAGPFVKYRAVDRATVVVDGFAAPPGTELLSIDIDSRSRPAAEAAELARAACLQVRDAQVLYKTVDSTMRGHLALEIEAAWTASGRRRAIFAPAFPAAGRTTRDGVQLLDGVDLGESSFATDARQAVATGNIETLLSPLPARPGLHGIAGTIEICDASSDDDLDAIVASAEDAEVLWIGSPGLAHALARKHREANTANRLPIAPIHRVAVIIGSMHAVNQTQLQHLHSYLGPAILNVEVGGPIPDSPVVVVTAPPVSDAVTAEAARAVGGDLARQARALLAAGYEGLIVTGGETVRAVVAGLAEPTVEVLDEPAPGIVRGRLASGAMLVTKAGGFGDADTLIGLYKHLTEAGGA
jgi:uncharacterized protein YgbK (DUF1537 family)